MKRGWAVLAVAGPVLALAAMAYLHATVAVDPVDTLLSEYALAGTGAVPFAVATLGLAAGLLALAFGLAGRSRVVRALFGCAAFGLVVMTVFPTDPEGGPMTVVGQIHRYSAGVTFVCIPYAGRMLVGKLPAARLRTMFARLTLACWIGLGTFLASRADTVFPAIPVDRVPVYGFTERLLLFGEVALVLAAAVTLRTPTPRTATPHPQTPHPAVPPAPALLMQALAAPGTTPLCTRAASAETPRRPPRPAHSPRLPGAPSGDTPGNVAHLYPFGCSSCGVRRDLVPAIAAVEGGDRRCEPISQRAPVG